MAYITIKSNADEDSMTLRESVLPSDLESEFFCKHLVERLRWAVEDAHAPSRRCSSDNNGHRLPPPRAESMLPL